VIGRIVSRAANLSKRLAISLRLFRFIAIVAVVVTARRFFGGYCVFAAEPAAKIDVGTAGRTERMEFLLGGLAANRTSSPWAQAYRIGLRH